MKALFLDINEDGDIMDHQLKNFLQKDPDYDLTPTIQYRITNHFNN